MSRCKKILLLTILAVGAAFVWQHGLVLAEDYGLGDTAGAAGLKSSRTLPQLVGDIIGTGLSFISVIFFILMLYGGFLWMTARGSSDQENKARDTIFGAVIGIIIVLAAYALTSFVFKSLGPGGDATTAAGTSGSNKCETTYGSDGLSCIDTSKTPCDTSKEALYQQLVTEKKIGKFNVDSIAGICPGNSSVLCCIPKK